MRLITSFALLGLSFNIALGVAYPGSIPGEAAVSDGGTFTYTIPIEVPPGTNGLQPKLALEYNSNLVAGIAGIGWTVSGVSMITRVGTNTYLEQDKTGRENFDASTFKQIGLDYTATDRFAIDGNRLVAVSGAYGANGTEYRTEIESFKRIKSYGSVGSGPAYFEVETKDGLIYEYGKEFSSTVVAYGKSEVRTWAVSKIRDLRGNQITFHYGQDPGEGEFYLDYINYSYNNGNYDGCVVDFDYGSEAIPEDKRYTKYIAGSKIQRNWLLQNIYVKHYSEDLKRYAINYEDSPNTADRRVKSIELFVGSSLTDYVEKTTFGYNTVDQTLMAKVNMNPEADEVGAFDGPGDIPSVFKLLDVNGDGRSEILKYYNSGTANKRLIEVFEFQQPSVDERYNTGMNRTYYLANMDIYEQYHPIISSTVEGDFNGDGRIDIISFKGNTDFSDIGSGYKRISTSYYLHLSNTTGFSTVISQAINKDILSSNNNISWQVTPVIADINGDGLDDIFLHRYQFTNINTVGSVILISKGDGTFNVIDDYASGAFNYGYQYPDISSFYGIYLVSNIFSGDFNGDGNSDICFTGRVSNGSYDDRYVRIYYSDGERINENLISNIHVGGYMHNSKILLLDMNGDGNKDFVYAYERTKPDSYEEVVLAQFINNGSIGSNAFNFVGDSVYDMGLYYDIHMWKSAYHNIESGDYNGDGLDDIISVYVNVNNTKLILSDGDRLAQSPLLYNSDTFFIVPNSHLYPPPGNDKDYLRLFSDIDGDGKTDIAFLSMQSWRGPAFVETVYSAYGKPNLLTSINNGEGLDYAIQYKPITSQAVYTDTAQTISYPLARARPPFYVTQMLHTDNGLTPQGYNFTSYSYGNALVHKWGFGFLGYGKVLSYDSTGARHDVKTLSQTYPNIGFQLYHEVYVENPHESPSISGDEYVLHQYAGATPATKSLNSNKTYFPYNSYTFAYNYEVSDDVPNDPNPYLTKANSFWYDDWGNNVYTVEEYYNAASTREYYKTTTNVFTNDSTNWLLGQLTATDITHNRLIPSTSNYEVRQETAAFAYYASTHANKGLLHWKRIGANPQTATSKWAQTTYTYDTFGNVLSQSETCSSMSARTTSYEYNEGTKRFPTKVTKPLQHITKTEEWDGRFGLPKKVEDPNGIIQLIEYDDLGRMTKNVTKAHTTGAETGVKYEYHSGGTFSDGRDFSTKKIEIPIHNNVKYAASRTQHFDRHGRLLLDETQGGPNADQKIFVHIHYDSKGRESMRSVPHFESTWSGDIDWTTTTYDKLNRPRTVTVDTDQGQVVTKNVYDGLEQDIIRDFGGKDQQTTIKKNLTGQVISVIDPLNQEWKYSFDAYGNEVKVVDPENRTTKTVAYSDQGLPLTVTTGDTGTTTYTYNGFGEPTAIINADGVETRFSIDTLGRVTMHRYIKSGTTTRFHYFDYDNFSGRTKSIGQIARERVVESSVTLWEKNYYYHGSGNSTGLLSEEREVISGTTYSTFYTYDDKRRQLRTTYPTGYWVQNAYNANVGYVTEVKDQNDRVWWNAPTFNASGSPLTYSQNFGSGHTMDYTLTYWGGRNLLRRSEMKKAGNIHVRDYNYDYDKLGNLERRKDHMNQQLIELFKYDDLNRLIGNTLKYGNPGFSDDPSTVTQSVFYDALGNFTTKDGSTYIYSSTTTSKKLTTWMRAGQWIENYYDSLGRNHAQWNYNTSSWDMYAYYYNNGHPSSITRGSNTRHFTYDARNNRITDSNGSTNTKTFVGSLYEKEVEGSTTTHRHYIQTPAGVAGFSEKVNTGAHTARIIYRDHLGSNSAIFTSDGTVVGNYSYDSWGAPRNPSTWHNYSYATAWVTYMGGRGYTDHQMMKDLKLIHMKGRIYDPYMGRFMSADIIVKTYNGQRHNLYSYVLNNPHRYIDPTGWSAADAQNFTFKDPFNFVKSINLGFKITLDTGEFTFGGGDTGAINDLTFTIGIKESASASDSVYSNLVGVRQSDERIAGEGVGTIWNRDYNASIVTDMPASELFNKFKSDINSFTDGPYTIADSPFSSTSGNKPVLTLGAVLKIDGPLKFNPSVRVTNMTDSSVTFTTLKGHPESGTITFSVTQVEYNQVNFNINSTMQASTRFDAILYMFPGKQLQTRIWTNTLNQAIKISGGTGTIEITTKELSD